ncbi:MAG TPA: hypothetical protein PKV98_04560 [Burkholderiaceae bacterium]|nr:hypothetical protein [Burkholderiaceae bacterium]
MSAVLATLANGEAQKFTTNGVANTNTTTALGAGAGNYAYFEVFNAGASFIQVQFGKSGVVATNAASAPVGPGQSAIVKRLAGDTHLAHLSLVGVSQDFYLTPVSSQQVV